MNKLDSFPSLSPTALVIVGVTALTTALSHTDPAFAKPTLPVADAKFKITHLALIDGSGQSVLTERGHRIWKEAIRIAAQYEDEELMDRMLSARKTSDGAAGEMVPEFLFEVYQKNPAFYVRRALAYHQGQMDAVAGEFVNEMTDKSMRELETPAKTVDPKTADGELIQKFLASAKKLAAQLAQDAESHVAEVCKRASAPIAQRVTLKGRMQCRSDHPNGFFVGELCLTSPGQKPIIVSDLRLENPPVGGKCGAEMTLTGTIDALKAAADGSRVFGLRVESAK